MYLIVLTEIEIYCFGFNSEYDNNSFMVVCYTRTYVVNVKGVLICDWWFSIYVV